MISVVKTVYVWVAVTVFTFAVPVAATVSHAVFWRQRSKEKVVQFVNLTPHVINLMAADGTKLGEIPASGTVARVSASSTTVREETVVLDDGTTFTVPIVKTTFGEVLDLPPPTEGVGFVVSRMVKAACPDREDLYVPQDMVRNENGVIQGCKSLDIS